MDSNQQKNLKTFLKNLPYGDKNLTYNHICRFVNENQTFWIRTKYSENSKNADICMIELAGFVLIAKAPHQIRISIPHTYPVMPADFRIIYHENQFLINNEPFLVSANSINISKNKENEKVILINYPFLKAMWQSDKRHICQVFYEIKKSINSPPLLISYQQQEKKVFNAPKFVGAAMTEKFITQTENKMVEVLLKVDKMIKYQNENDQIESRIDFLQRNISKLSLALKNKEDKVNQSIAQLQNIHEDMLLSNNCDALLSLDNHKNEKIKRRSELQALKQIEKRFLQILERGLREKKCSFEKYKSLLRMLYDKMFEAKLRVLQYGE